MTAEETNDDHLTSSQLSNLASDLYPRGPSMMRLLQRWRPYICPFGAIIESVPIGATILDVGCGGGLFLGLLAATGRRPHGVGIDLSTQAIAAAQSMVAELSRKNHDLDLRFIRSTVHDPWPSGRFDVVSMIDLLHHIPPDRQEAVFKAGLEAVAPGGLVVYKDMCVRPRWRAAANQLHDLLLARQWVHQVDVNEIDKLAASRHFVNVVSRRINMLWYGHDLRVFRRPK